MPIGIYEKNDIDAVASKIREKTETEKLYKPSELSSGVDEVYEAGRKSQYDEFWDVILSKGTRIYFGYAFNRWATEYVRPNRRIIPKQSGSLNSTFAFNSHLKKVESEYFDFSQIPYSGNVQNGYYYTFSDCLKLLEIEDIGVQKQSGLTQTFAQCASLVTIDVIRVSETTIFNGAFINCRSLENLTIEGTIGQNGFNVQWSTKLSHESLMSIINALRNNSGTDTWNTITLGADNIAKLTQEELEIMHLKQWEYT